MSDKSKRRSILFPFRAPKEPAKFEVVNRKKSPLVDQHRSSTTATPIKPQPAPTTTTSGTVPTTSSASRQHTERSSTTSRPPNAPSHPHIPHIPQLPTSAKHSFEFTHHSGNDKANKETISRSDVPSGTLNIVGDVPPVPDYNSRFFAPPVTIQGRAVSVKKGVPARKKPPSFYQSPSTSHSSETQTSSLMTNIDENSGIDNILDSQGANVNQSTQKGQIEERKIPEIVIDNHEDVPPPSTNQKSEIIDINKDSATDNVEIPHSDSPLETKGLEENIPTSTNAEEPVISEYDTAHIDDEQLPQKAEIANASVPADEEASLPDNEPSLTYDKTPLQPEIEEPVLENQEQQQQPEIDDVTDHTLSRELEATPGAFIFPASSDQNSGLENNDEDFINDFKPPNLPRSAGSNRLSLASNGSEFFDADDHIGQSSDNLVLSRDDYHEVSSQEADEDLNDQSDVSSVSSSIIVKPLQFHKKTASTASASSSTPHIYNSPTVHESTGFEKTHEKKISLSDELMRDIENFQPGLSGFNDDGYENDISPVSPLKFDETLPTRSGLLDEEWESDEYEPFDDRNLVKRPSTFGEPNEEEVDQNSLFNDSSDEQPDQYYGDSGNYDGNISSTSLSKSSSVRPEIDYEPSPAPDSIEPLSKPEVDSIHSIEQGFEKDLVLDSPKYYQSSDSHSIPQTVPSSSDQDSYQPDHAHSIPYSNSIHERFSTGDDVDSKYSYTQQAPQEVPLHIVNNADSIHSNSEKSYNYLENVPKRTFHVVNDGNYSDSDNDDTNSFEINGQDDQLQTDYSVVHQQESSPSNSADQDSGISFTAKSPIRSGFTFDQAHPTEPYEDDIATSSFSLNSAPRSPEKQPPSLNLTNQSVSPQLSAVPRRDEVVAPVQYLDQQKPKGRTRRPPPSDTPTATRAGRSASIHAPVPNAYNSIREDTHERNYTHVPEKSSYVETLRFGSGTTNSVVSAQTWGLPIGISEVDHSKKPTASKATYRKPRANKVDLKHGKIKPRLLASEVDDDDDVTSTIFTEKRESIELERFKTQGSGTSFNGMSSPTTNSSSGFSPRKSDSISMVPSINSTTQSSNSTLQRSGTLMSEHVNPAALLGRTGTVLDRGQAKHGMSLFIVNPDVDSD